MKQLTKITLFAAFCAVSTLSFAQVNFGIKAGLNLANIISNEDDFETKLLPTFQIGAVVDLGITDALGVQTGVSLQGKGFKFEEDFLGETVKTTANPLYVQVPAHLMYKGNSFFVGAGPYVGFGVGGKVKASYAGESETEDITFGNSEDDFFAPLDFGVGVQVGGMIGAIRIGAGFDLGLSDIAPKDSRSSDFSNKNSVISVFAAYMFNN